MEKAEEGADTDLMASLPVYLSSSLPESARLQLFQYPLYPSGRPLPVPASAAQQNQHIASRWRSNANRVEIDMPVDMRETVYDADKGAAIGDACKRIGRMQDIDGGIKREGNADPPRFDSMRLDSAAVPNATQYVVGVIHNSASI